MYLETDWSEKLRQNPKACAQSKIRKGFYKCVITKQTTVYYTFDSDMIYLLMLFDNRQDPKILDL